MVKKNKKVTIIVQARMDSLRFPNKIVEKIGNKPAIIFLLERVLKSKNFDNLVVATTNSKSDDNLVNILRKKGFKVYRGSSKNVLERYYKVSKKFKSNYVVRITGDCPFIDYKILDEMILKIKRNDYDYISNINPPTYPDGFDVEIFKFDQLENAFFKAKKLYDKEHVTPYIIKNANKKFNFSQKQDYSNVRLTLDVPSDIKVLNDVKIRLKKKYFLNKDIINLFKKNKKIFSLDRGLIRNIGGKMKTGQKMWERAKNVIPGGNMLLSKRPEMFLPNEWPTYFSKAKGCHVWDLDGKKYLDFSTMSVGTNLLGYCNNNVDREVKKSIKKGNMSSLNCPEEVYLAEKLIKMHKNLDMVRFAKTGGEANSIAIRIARAFSKKDNVAFCGYHGWHDWYLSANLSSKENLNTHLLNGLPISGVPKKLRNTVFPFKYNDINGFYKICKKNKIGVVKMEVHRNFAPKRNFLKKISDFCKKKNIVLIFDECTSGFRETFGGIHLKYGVTPDICILGKALGNGYPITAILGKKSIMDCAQNTFISSTFWTDRTGFVAAIKTLNEMKKIKSWKLVTNNGKKIKKKWKILGKKHKLKLQITGLNAIPSFKILSKNWLKYKSYITHVMLKKSILASNLIFLSVNHDVKIMKKYFKVLDKIFKKIREFEKGKEIEILNKIPECHEGFKRLN